MVMDKQPPEPDLENRKTGTRVRIVGESSDNQDHVVVDSDRAGDRAPYRGQYPCTGFPFSSRTTLWYTCGRVMTLRSIFRWPLVFGGDRC
jgi:hypothetical protein